MQVLPTKRRGGLRNKNGERLENLCKSNILETTFWELARNLFPFESTNNIKITHL